MKVTLSFEKTQTKDTSIMVDALRASTTITLALNNFDKIIPCFTPQEAFKLKEKNNAVIAGERSGIIVEGFDIGNSPREVENFPAQQKTLILTTSNGTRILKDMESKVLIGAMVNAKAVGYKSTKIAENEIDVVMAGYKGNFTLEDFLASGEILYWIYNKLNGKCEISDYAKAAILASRDYNALKEGFYKSNSGIKLARLNSKADIDCCVLKNISKNVGIYKNNYIYNSNII